MGEAEARVPGDEEDDGDRIMVGDDPGCPRGSGLPVPVLVGVQDVFEGDIAGEEPVGLAGSDIEYGRVGYPGLVTAVGSL